MPKFKVSCTWEVIGDFEVEAESLDDAIDKVENSEEPFDGLPSDSEYVDGSFQVIPDCCEEIE